MTISETSVLVVSEEGSSVRPPEVGSFRELETHCRASSFWKLSDELEMFRHQGSKVVVTSFVRSWGNGGGDFIEGLVEGLRKLKKISLLFRKLIC